VTHNCQVIRGVEYRSMRTVEIASGIVRCLWVKSIRDIIDLRRLVNLGVSEG